MQFRQWIQHMWFKHLDELDSYRVPVLPNYNLNEYFNNYKYWLKREFKHQRQTGFTNGKSV